MVFLSARFKINLDIHKKKRNSEMTIFLFFLLRLKYLKKVFLGISVILIL